MKIETIRASEIQAGDCLEYYGSPRKVLRVKRHIADLMPAMICFEMLLSGEPGMPNQYVYRYAFEMVVAWKPTEI